MILQSAVAFYLGLKGLPTRKFLIAYGLLSLSLLTFVPYLLEDTIKIYSALYIPGMCASVLHDYFFDVIYSGYDLMTSDFIEDYIDCLTDALLIFCITEIPITILFLRFGQALTKHNHVQRL